MCSRTGVVKDEVFDKEKTLNLVNMVERLKPGLLPMPSTCGGSRRGVRTLAESARKRLPRFRIPGFEMDEVADCVELLTDEQIIDAAVLAEVINSSIFDQ